MLLRRTLLTLALASAGACAADTPLLNLLATDPAMLAGLNVVAARDSVLGQRVLTQMKTEDANFQKLVEVTGFDPRRDLSEILVSSDGKSAGATLVAVRGAFPMSKIVTLLEVMGATRTPYQGVDVWTAKYSAQSAVAIVDETLALFGKPDAVRAAIERRAATTPALDAELLARLARWSGHDAWFVSTIGLPTLGAGPSPLPAGISAEMIRCGAAGVNFRTNLAVSGRVTTRSATDATTLVDLYLFGLSLARLNASEAQAAELVKLADTAVVSANGADVTFALTIPEAMLDAILQNMSRTSRQAHAR